MQRQPGKAEVPSVLFPDGGIVLQEIDMFYGGENNSARDLPVFVTAILS